MNGDGRFLLVVDIGLNPCKHALPLLVGFGYTIIVIFCKIAITVRVYFVDTTVFIYF